MLAVMAGVRFVCKNRWLPSLTSSGLSPYVGGIIDYRTDQQFSLQSPAMATMDADLAVVYIGMAMTEFTAMNIRAIDR